MKLLFILLLGLGFTQTKLETRLFEISSDDASDVTENFYMFELSEIIGFETDFALISPYVEFPYGADNSSYVFMFCETNGLQNPIKFFYNGIMSESHYSTLTCWDIETLDHNGEPGLWFGIDNDNTNISLSDLNIKIAVTAEFPEEDTGYIGDMNNDGALNVYDVLILVGIILDGDSGDIFDVMEIIKRV